MIDIEIKELYIAIDEKIERTSKALKDYYQKFSRNLKELISEKDNFTLFFYANDGGNVIAQMYFKSGEIIDIQFSISKASGNIGERITYQLKDMPKYSILHALNEYFGKVSFSDGRKIIKTIDQSRSYFLRSKKGDKPFIFSIARVINGAKGINYEINSGFDSNKCEIGSDINNYILLRSLDADSIPYHTCVVERDIIIEALISLNPYYLGILEAWYELNLTSNQDISKVTEDILNQRYSDDMCLYKRAWNARQSALKMLIKNIIKIQDCSQIIGMIENQESKPFNPLELGFEMSLSFIKLPNKSYSKNTEKGCFEINHFNNGLFKVTGIQQLIKIPNHRQGVELLRNLGIIDAD